MVEGMEVKVVGMNVPLFSFDVGTTRFVMILSSFFFSSRRRHTRLTCDWSSDVCSSDLRAESARAARIGVMPYVVTRVSWLETSIRLFGMRLGTAASLAGIQIRVMVSPTKVAMAAHATVDRKSVV